MDSLTFLQRTAGGKVQPVYVLYGDEDFLKRRVRAALVALVLGEGADAREFGLSTHPGDRASFPAIHDELQTLPFLSPRRLVVVEDADNFVTRNRQALEEYFTRVKPSVPGVLVLEVKSWPANTRLAKMLP